MRKRVYFSAVIVFILAIWVLLSRGNDAIATRNHAPANYVAAEGRVSVKPDQRAVLSAEVAGRLEQVHVDNLAPVKKGQLLAVQYNADLSSRIRQTEESYRMAEARYRESAAGYRSEEIEVAAAEVRRAESELDLAKQNEERDRQLLQQEIVAESRYDTTIAETRKAEASLAAAQERHKKMLQGERKETIEAARAEMMSQRFALESLKATYEKTFIRSPLDGIVVRRYLNSSEFADAGVPVLEVANLSEMIIDGEINEMDAGRVVSGAKAIVTSDAFPDREFAAVVYEVSEALKTRSSEPSNPAILIDQKVLPVKLRFTQNVPLKLGMRVDLKILL